MPTTFSYDANPYVALDTGALLQEIVRCLVDNPYEVSVIETVSDSEARFDVRVSPNDIGQVAGREGRTIDLLTRLLGRVEGKNKREVQIRIVRPRNGARK